jgi:hypothetical protein
MRSGETWQQLAAPLPSFTAVVKSYAPLVPLKDFDPDQPRDEEGRWTDTGAGDGGGGAGAAAGEKPSAGEPELHPDVIEVGGDEWNKVTARRLERQYQDARPKVEKLASDAVGKTAELADVDEDEEPPFVPEEWDMLTESQQDDAKEQYVDKSKSDYLDSEIENWQSEQAPDEARDKVAYDFNQGNEQEWAYSALTKLRENYEDEGKKDIPFTDEQLVDALTIEYDTGHYPWQKGLDISFDDKVLHEAKQPEGESTLPGIEPADYSKLLTEDMRADIRQILTDGLNDRADDVVQNMEPPVEYLADNAEQFAGESWDQMDDSAKFEWLSHNTNIVDDASDAGAEPAIAAMQLDALPQKFDPLNETSGTDYKRTQALARYLSVARTMEVLKERKIADEWLEQHGEGMIAKADNQLWKEWKASSTTREGKLLQLATAEELGGRLNSKTRDVIDADSLKKFADSEFAGMGGYAGIKAYVRAKWEVTQYLLDKAGVRDLNLYRGIALEKDTFEKLYRAGILKHYGARVQVAGHEFMPTLEVLRNGAASTTTDPDVANGWSNSATRVVLRAHVPRTAAISIPAYGINVHSEHEVVVAGTAWKGWDAWARKAPRLEDVPLKHAA